MLKPAVMYEEKLNIKYNSVAFDDKYKYFNAINYFEFNINIKRETWDKIQMVSVNSEDEVVGFLQATIDRTSDAVSSLWIANFQEINYTFSKDFYQFLDDLLMKFNFRKVVFSVVVGNPAEKMYDKFCKRYNGRIIGTKLKEVKLQDNQYYDHKFYEIFREDYLKERRQ